ncbi:hypothetical protein AYJ57_24575 (plasmid) [Salipiger sp. CCB-MM3]|uniref:RidA family protein n=1 Tax=Salipiger sp. CCB-MM3 TaxID=1792508 RepID=UPI00080A9DD8|nr:RidA family protein [Salipiger sp. CCB-MM3]ANT63654.1 hypothetical protein AYJ57_24575 [Salipiger sp. CCB-MM3]
MTDIQRTFQIDGVPEATGPWARAVEWNGLIFISGLRGIDPATGLPAATLEARMALILDHLQRTLAHHGSDLASVLSTRAYVTDMAGLRPAVNDFYETAFGAHLPTRTILEVAGLNQGDDVEIECTARRIGGAA